MALDFYASSVDDVMKALRERLVELRSIVTGLGEDQLALPSACEGWDTCNRPLSCGIWS